MPDSPIPEAYAKYVGADKTEKERLLNARLAAPIPPKSMLPVLFYLTLDESQAVRGAAMQSVSTLPEHIALASLKEPLPPDVLKFFADQYGTNQTLLETILLNRATPDAVFATFAATAQGRILDIISENQERYIRTLGIFERLKENPAVPKNTIDRITHFLTLAGVISVEAPKSEPVVLKEVDGADQVVEDKKVETQMIVSTTKEHLNDQERENLFRQISTMLPGAKIQLALKGNKEARGYLVRDSNKLVATAVMRSPKLNENEVSRYATIPNVCEDALRMMASSPQWSKSYAVRSALVNNPKTPMQYSAQFIKVLTVRDLAAVSRNKNIPSQLAKMAKLLLKEKRK